MTATRLDEMIFTRVVSDELFERAGASSPRRVWQRARGLPALGIPVDHRRRRLATAVSVLIHLAMVWVLLRPEPLTNLNPNLQEIETGGGGPGPAGGGGGGTRGTGGVKYVQIAPPPQAVVPPLVETVVPPVIEPPKPVVADPVLPRVDVPKLTVADPKAEIKVESPIIGTGGGTGNDGTKGNGPGTGGGVGSGIGTGRGSGVGPGTGGGNLDHYPCESTELSIMPIPVPARIKGTKVIAHFDVDERGKVLKFEFTPTRDGDYNRKLNDLFKGYKFRPGTTLDGVPRRTTCQISFEF
jgi:protein TonB